MSSPSSYSIFSPTHNVASSASVFKRCVQCDPSPPPCPKCDKGETCTMISRSCSTCPSSKCVRTSSGGSSSSSSGKSTGGGSNAGAIAGGVVGGVAFVSIVTLLVWWFFIRKKRNDQSQQELSEGQLQGQEKENNGSGSGSTLTGSQQGRNSIASTVLTRASNVIPIAYIPGVTNRSPQGTPDGLVPPVPPLPDAQPEQHFFVPGDLRGSTWSGTSGLTGQTSVADTSRSSVATTVYRNDAIVNPMPAQQAMRTRAAVVSIHNGNNNNNNSTNNTPTSLPSLKVTPSDVPAVPAITKAQLARAGVTEVSSSPVVARQVMAKPVSVTRSSSRKGPSEVNSTSTSAAHSGSSSSGQAAPRGAGDNRGVTAAAVTEPSPFDDQAEASVENAGDKQKQATNSTAKEDCGSQSLVENGESPFSDANEMK